MEYIILTDDKKPTHKFSTPAYTKTKEEVAGFDNVAMVVPAGYAVIDFDTTSDAEIAMQIVEALDIKCNVMKTDRGYHMHFRTGAPIKCFTKSRLACGIYSDCKSGDKRSYVIIRRYGKNREWIRKYNYKELDLLPPFFLPIGAPMSQFNFKGMSDGDGRNQELYNYILHLQNKGFTKEQVIDTIEVINNFVFADPLEDFEIKQICRDEAFKSDDEIQAYQEKNGSSRGFNHNEFAEEILQQNEIISVNDQLYIFHNGYYKRNDKMIERKMIELYPGIKKAQRAEVIDYMKIQRNVPREKIKIEPYIINLNNTRLDIRDNSMLDFDPTVYEFSRMNVNFDPKAYSEDLDKMLKKVFCNDRELMDLFEEMLGSCLIKNCRFQKAFMLTGGGSNGKSTVLNLIKKFLGEDNYSSLELDKLTERFNVVQLENKLANLGDDVNNVALKDTGTIKKLFSGESVSVERKGENPYTIKPYATHIYSCNEIPKSFDKTNGFYRRWCFIGFNATFSRQDPDFDPMIEDKISTPQALSYLLNLALNGVKRLLENGKFSEPESVKNALNDYMIENSTVLSWIDDQGLTEDYFLERAVVDIYSDFTDWCKLSGVKNVTGKKSFSIEIKNFYGFDKDLKQKKDGKRYFIMEI